MTREIDGHGLGHDPDALLEVLMQVPVPRQFPLSVVPLNEELLACGFCEGRDDGEIGLRG
jgi:hypothetical protein